MKKITYYLILMSLVFSFHSCDDEDYKDLNITQNEEEVSIKELVGDLTSHIVLKNLNNEELTNVDMGEVFYIIDNTEGGASERTWTFSQGSNSVTYETQLIRHRFDISGEATISLTSVRSSDGKSITSEINLPVNFVPVTAGFKTLPLASAGDVINIKTGDYVTFADVSGGLPEVFDWTFEGGTPVSGAEKEHSIRYETAGVYGVTYKISREDNPGEFYTDQLVKTAYVNVAQRIVDLVRAVATDSKIELQFSEPIAQDVTSDAIAEFSVKINTKAGTTLTPEILGLEVTGDSTLMLTFADKMFSDDEVLISFIPTGILKDATGLHLPEAVTDEPCVYGHNILLNTDMEDPASWIFNSNHDGGSFLFVNENSGAYSMKPYQGHTCAVIVKGSGNVSVSVPQGIKVAEGDVIEFAYEAQRLGNIGGTLERRISTVSGNGSNDANGNWSAANQGGVGSWQTVKKTLNISADTKGNSGTLYFNFMRYNGSETEGLWVDNLRIYVPKPRP